MGIFNKKKDNDTKATLKYVTSRLAELRMPTSLVFTPVNLEEEKKKFFESDNYNPVFKYRIVKNDNYDILEELSSIEEIVDVDPRISEFYIKLIDDKRQTNEMMHAVGDNEAMTELSIEKFKLPSPILFRNACRVLRGKNKIYNVIDSKKIKQTEMLDYNRISDIFKVVLQEIGLEDWSVAKSLNIAHNGVKVGVKTKEILMDGNIQKTALEIKKTIVHEVGTHVLRSYNGALSGFAALAKPNINEYLDVEEGLAMWNEEYMGYLKDKDLKERAGIVYAIYIGRELTFRQLYNVMLGFYPRKTAFNLVYRVKRGLGDTSVPGIYAKDVVYFRGFRRIRKRLAEDMGLYSKLYAGKIGYRQVEWVDDGLIKEGKIVPSRKMFDSAFKKAGI